MSEGISNTQAGDHWRASALAPFKTRAFAVFWAANAFSAFGGMIQTVGASWHMTTLTKSTALIALVQTASALPYFLLSLIAGALADNYDRRRIMLLSQLVMLALSILLTYLAWIRLLTPWMLLGFTFLIGCGAAIYGPIWASSIAEFVERRHIPAAVIANAVGFNVARSTGPALGGILVAAFGVTISFFANTVSYLGVIFALMKWRYKPQKSPLPPEPLGAALASGFHYVRLSPHLLAILIRTFVFTFAAASLLSLMPIVSRDLLGGGVQTYGVMLGGFGIGALGGAVSGSYLRIRNSSEKILQLLSAMSCLTAIAIGASPWTALTFIIYAFGGAVWMIGTSNFNIAIQISSPRWVTGRTVASYQSIAFGGVALGSWVWGELANDLGVRASMCAAGAASLINLLLSRRMQVRVAEMDGLDPHEAGSVILPPVDMHSSSGPIVVVVEYRVLSTNATEFVSVINELGRVRRRDGARAWSICQDIDVPEIWIERFESPTWLDHLRRQTRPTKEDQRLRNRVASLVDGGSGKVRRYIGRPPGSEPVGIDPQDAVPSVPIQAPPQ